MGLGFAQDLSLRQLLELNAAVASCPAPVVVGDLVRISAANAVTLAQSNSPLTMPAIGVVVLKPTATTCVVVGHGIVDVFGGLTPGDQYFVSSTVAGGIQAIPGPQPQRIGVAISTTAILFGVSGGSTGGVLNSTDKALVPSVTLGDGATTGLTISATPVSGSYVAVFVDGSLVTLGNGTKIGVHSYFSVDGGLTPRTIPNIVLGDTLYWNGTTVGFELDGTDRVDLVYSS